MRRRLGARLALGTLILLVLLAACAPNSMATLTPPIVTYRPPDTPLPPQPTVRPSNILAVPPPVYVTVALHIEDLRAYANCQAYPDYREKLLQFAQTIAPYRVAVNLQTDYEFLVGVARCETPALQASTGGQNVLEYLATHYGYEIDPHQEGGWDRGGPDNYADIRYLAGQLTTRVSENIGGLVWDDPGQWVRLVRGERGLRHPDFTWTPRILTLAVSSRHRLGDFTADDFASGVWRPKGPRGDFWTHDPNGPLIYIGPGEYDNWGGGGRWGKRTTPEFVQHILSQLRAGTLDPDAMYTATLAVPQHIIFDPEKHILLQALLERLNGLASTGQVVYVTYSQAAYIWQTQYSETPNIYLTDRSAVSLFRVDDVQR